MCGVIVVEIGRSRSTYHRRDAYFMIIALDIFITMRFSINCPTVFCLPTMCFLFEREASSENYAPRVYFLSYIKIKNFAAIFLYLFYFVFLYMIKVDPGA